MRITLRGCLPAAALLLASAQYVAAQEAEAKPERAKPANPAGQPEATAKPLTGEDVKSGTVVVNPANAGPRFWIGLHCGPIKPEVRAQLTIPDGKGVVVEQVLPDSPAQKAGLKPHDILLAAGEKELASVEDLSEAIQKAGKVELALSVLRGGEKQKIVVTPADNPHAATFQVEELPRFFEGKVRPFPPGGPEPFRFHIVRPGIVVDIGRPVDLPDDVKVTVTKQGKAPAEITVVRGDKTWKATEEKLDELPEDVRPWVKRSLGASTLPKGQAGADVMLHRFGPEAGAFVPGERIPHGGGPRHQRGVEQRIEETLKQLEALQKTVEDLRKDLPKTAPPQ